MTTEKTFTRVGISKCEKGRVRFRFTNDPKREKVLIKAGHEDITFFELDAPLTKEAATAFLLSKGLQENDPVAEARAARAAEREAKAAERAAARAAKAAEQTEQEPSREDDEALLAALAAGEAELDEEADEEVAEADEEVAEADEEVAEAA